MSRRKGKRLPPNLSTQLTKGYDGTGEGHRSDEDPQINLNIVDGFLSSLIVLPIRIEIGGVAHQNGSQPHQAVKNRHQLRHLGHLDPSGEDKAHHAAKRQRSNKNCVVPLDSSYRGNQRDCHSQHAIKISPPCGFLITQSPQCKDEENDCSEVGSVCKLVSHFLLRLEASPYETSPAFDGSLRILPRC